MVIWKGESMVILYSGFHEIFLNRQNYWKILNFKINTKDFIGKSHPFHFEITLLVNLHLHFMVEFSDIEYWYFFADSNFIPTQIASEQHYSWCTLGFVRAIATSPGICESLSSQKWIDLLLKILEDEKPSQPTKNIIKQVLVFETVRCVY